MKEECEIKSILQIAGAFIAWVIGSGFATGQEVLQFFSSYGYMSFFVVLINLFGFIIIGYLVMRTGFENKEDEHFNHFKYFCGDKAGLFYTWLITITLLLIMPVLVAGAGATVYEYYGFNRYIGSAIMILLVLSAYLIGFERMIRIISSIGPSIIVFSLIVGVITLFRDMGRISEVGTFDGLFVGHRAAPHWLLSGLLYLGLNLFPGSAYLLQLGHTASSKKELKYGAIIGGSALMMSVLIISTAIMLNGDAIAKLDIPVLYLAQKISYILGAIFSVVLMLGIFSSSSAIMWSICSRFTFKGKRQNTLFAVGIAVFVYCISLFSFSDLIGKVYPIIGYIGLFFIACVIYKGIIKKYIEKRKCSTE